MPTAIAAPAIERELHIKAKPETVFELLTNPKRIPEWMGREAWVEPRPGGVYRVDYNGFDIARGTIVEMEPPTRFVVTWGWESLAPGSLRPGASRVEYTLSPDADGTRLRMVHSGLSEADAASHGQGWDMFLPVLAARSEGRPGAPAAAALSTAEGYASRLNTLLIQLIETIEATPADRWKNPVDTRPANVVARHAVDHLGLVDFARAIASGQRAPQADLAHEDVDAGNAATACEFANISKEEVITELKQRGPKAVDSLKAMSDAELAKTQSMRFAGGAELSAAQVIEMALLHDIADHTDHIRRA